MEIDFDSVDHVTDFVTVPAGSYLCRVAEVRPGSTRAGDERWSLRLVVAEGEHVGKQAAWDSLVFSARGRARARLVFAALGLPANGRVQVDASDLEGREALIQIRPAEYAAPSGETIRRNEVPYDGYRAVPAGTPTAPEGGGDDDEHTAGSTNGRPRGRKRGDAATDEIPF
ncbi:MAG: DUF669 domain-containing protein [Planctomycetota bacterium]